MIVKCSKCGGNVDVARLRTRGEEVELVGVFSLDTSPLEARVCRDCGNVELYAMRPEVVAGQKQAGGVSLTANDE